MNIDSVNENQDDQNSVKAGKGHSSGERVESLVSLEQGFQANGNQVLYNTNWLAEQRAFQNPYRDVRRKSKGEMTNAYRDME